MIAESARQVVVAVCAGIPLAAWLFSLRRTPRAGPWFVGVLFAALYALTGFVYPHVTVVGLACATGLPIAIVTGVCVLVTETFAADPTDPLHRHRAQLRAKEPKELRRMRERVEQEKLALKHEVELESLRSQLEAVQTARIEGVPLTDVQPRLERGEVLP